jgi:hypothetical protein
MLYDMLLDLIKPETKTSFFSKLLGKGKDLNESFKLDLLSKGITYGLQSLVDICGMTNIQEFIGNENCYIIK